MKTLVYIEEHEGEPTTASLGIVSKMAQLGTNVAAVLCGFGLNTVAPAIGNFGASRVYLADDPALAFPLSQPRVDALACLVRERGFDAVLFPTSTLASDVAAGLSARLEAGLNWGLTDLELRDGQLVGRRLALDDSVLLEVGWTRKPRLALIRPGSFEPRATGGRAEVEAIAVECHDWSSRVVVLEQDRDQSGDQSIEEAEVIVAGGLGLERPESFALLEDLAGALGGSVAGTLPVVDKGWHSRAALVGQTGKTVTPRLYIACGISGAIQHKTGMGRSETIIAINNDRRAPIFSFCDLGVVGDLHQIVPELTQLLRQRNRAGEN